MTAKAETLAAFTAWLDERAAEKQGQVVSGSLRAEHRQHVKIEIAELDAIREALAGFVANSAEPDAIARFIDRHRATLQGLADR